MSGQALNQCTHAPDSAPPWPDMPPFPRLLEERRGVPGAPPPRMEPPGSRGEPAAAAAAVAVAAPVSSSNGHKTRRPHSASRKECLDVWLRLGISRDRTEAATAAASPGQCAWMLTKPAPGTWQLLLSHCAKRPRPSPRCQPKATGCLKSQKPRTAAPPHLGRPSCRTSACARCPRSRCRSAWRAART